MIDNPNAGYDSIGIEDVINRINLTDARTVARLVFNAYNDAYGGEIQGCCLLIADEIRRKCGGEVVAGFLTWHGGACRRSHWWVDFDGTILDPMGDHLLSFEDFPGREEAHRDRTTFENLLPEYEQWRVT